MTLTPSLASTAIEANDDGAANPAVEAVLYRFTDRLFRAQTLGEIYVAGLDAICSALSSSRASILRFDMAGVMRFAAWRGLSLKYRSAVEGHSPWKPWERDANAIFVEDISLSGESPTIIETVVAEGIRALAFIPLADTDHLLGKFMVYYDTPRVFTESERRVALVISRQLGFALDRYFNDASARRLTALVESSDDAIVAKDLDGTITDWNSGAERLFGYSREQAVGQSVTLIIPEDRRHEEPAILARIRKGERIEHFETVRQRKDGTLVEISLTVSPIKDLTGRIVGASKIARDISERRRAQEQQELLMREMNHRVKNLFAIASGIVNLSAHSVAEPRKLAAVVSERLGALARAHALAIGSSEGSAPLQARLHRLIETILAPYQSLERRRFEIAGADVGIPADLITPLSLLLNEFATNAVKYGGLSTPQGSISIACEQRANEFAILWQERGSAKTQQPITEGFGTKLVQVTARQVGRVTYAWEPAGIAIELVIERLPSPAAEPQAAS